MCCGAMSSNELLYNQLSCAFCADAIRQMVKYSKPEESTVVSFDSKMHG